MGTILFYYFILFVYVSLWICQLIACHLTHSLVILTDSYINLYRILDISLGILHLSTQQTFTRNRAKLAEAASSQSITNKSSQTPAHKFLNSVDTYQYKRLPLLGSFVNGMFLAALLMSAAIEGLQTCFHVKHSENRDQKTILTENAATYPIILVGFAFVGLIMQYCSLVAHQLRDEELCSESLLDLRAEQKRERTASKQTSQQVSIKIRELDANGLHNEQLMQSGGQQAETGKRRSYDLDLHKTSSAERRHSSGPTGLNCHREFPLRLAASELPNDETKQVSLRSMRFPVEVTSDTKAFDTQICFHHLNMDQSSGGKQSTSVSSSQTRSSASKRDNWFYVRCLASPVAMLICAAIFYSVDIELMTEISDAALAVSVVFLLFAASLPPMRKAGKILLQTVPDGVDLKRLQLNLERCSRDGDVIEVKDLHVWSLTPRSNRVATCRLVLDKNNVRTEAQVEQIIAEANFRFLDQRIKCTTIEPVLVERNTEAVAEC